MAKGGKKKAKYDAQKLRSSSNKAKNIANAKALGDKKAGVSLTQADYKPKVKKVASTTIDAVSTN